ncbi:hypothetical protein OVN18_07660 [Microcella daejeonensis]|uniref:Uncharacterized protein n=1 Tax=Microcella daejeonensis TaxID=2994971 RepID=A0A9E8S8H4_9MICO|nr:hypothetical protein [Microcella daejeonensis]WAB80451.1 hypothetical protein OVN18_07660 [Microcella daejeonensis]
MTIQLVILVVAEVLLFRTYSVHDARFHWATHFLVAVLAAAVAMIAFLVIRRAPGPRFPLLLVLGLHLYAMAPDLVFRAGTPHAPWMDVFLGHISVHYIPGGDTTWLIAALVAIGAYVIALTRWLRVRTPREQTPDAEKRLRRG